MKARVTRRKTCTYEDMINAMDVTTALTQLYDKCFYLQVLKDNYGFSTEQLKELTNIVDDEKFKLDITDKINNCDTSNSVQHGDESQLFYKIRCYFKEEFNIDFEEETGDDKINESKT